jgi:uncharacterized membrane protein
MLFFVQSIEGIFFLLGSSVACLTESFSGFVFLAFELRVSLAQTGPQQLILLIFVTDSTHTKLWHEHPVFLT